MFSERLQLGLAREGNKERSQTRTVLGEEGVKKLTPQTHSDRERTRGPHSHMGAVIDT